MSKLMNEDDKLQARRLDLKEFSMGGFLSEGDNPSEEDVVETISQEDIDQIKQSAYEEGFNKGVEDGVAAASEQMNVLREKLEQAIAVFIKPLEQFDNDVEQELVLLSLAVAKQIVRRELKTDPAQVVAVVREALLALPKSSRGVKFYMHPEDALIVREIIPPTEGEEGWSIVEDPVMQRGGCRVETLTSEIDATLEGRIAAIAATILGGERSQDES